MKIKVKKLRDDAVIPAKAHPTDAGYDLTAVWSGWNNATQTFEYGFGLSFEIPEGYVGLVFPRSSLSKKDIALSNAVGVIDSGYRGEVTAKFKPTNYFNCYEDYGRIVECPHYGSIYGIGERIAQMIILPYPQIEFEEVDELSQTERADGGYGSTGL